MTSASTEAGVLAEIVWVLIIGGALVFAATMGVVALALRRRKRPVATRTWIITGGLLVPTAVLAVLGAYSAVRTDGLDDPPPPGALVVSVTGRLWWWDLQYRDPVSGRPVASANELRLPVGRPVHLGLVSHDVIHSFWVPALGGKMDLVPGRVNRLVVHPHTPGVYRGACAEFCGEQHAKMALQVVVMPAEAFDQWLAAQAGNAAEPATALAQRGRQVFNERACAQCHTVRGVAEGAKAGPDLTHVASRLHLGAGTVANSPEALARWITLVQQLKPGARMPSGAHLPPADLEALAAWLATLQ